MPELALWRGFDAWSSDELIEYLRAPWEANGWHRTLAAIRALPEVPSRV